jgi:hypothetical protein
MIRKTFICLFFICMGNTIRAQKNINLILSIDDNIVTNSFSNIRIISISNTGETQTIEADYHPGNLSLKQSDYEKLLDSSIKTVFLAFDYKEYCHNIQQNYNYKIDLNKGWLGHYYFILHIYNINKKRYNKVYTPLKGRTYTYEVEYPGGAVKRTRKIPIDNCN